MHLTLQLTVWLVTLVVLTGMHFILSMVAINARKESKSYYAMPKEQCQIAAIRAQGNFCEMVPITLLLLLGLSFLNPAPLPFLLFSILLIASRALHATSLLCCEQAETPSFKFRRYGMAIHLFVNLASAVYILELLLKSLFHS